MLSNLIFLLFAMISSFFSVRYLRKHLKLLISGRKTLAKVTSYKLYDKNIFYKNMTVPRMTFEAESGKIVSNTPKHTAFSELNFYVSGNEYPVIYDKSNPDDFVVDSFIEVVMNSLVVLATLIYIVWFFVKIIKL